MSKVMKWLSLLILCSGTVSFAQDNIPERYLEVRGISELDLKPLGKAVAHLSDGSGDIQTIQTGADGSFSFKLEINKQYTIEVEKEGLIAKKISFNTAMPDEEKGVWVNEFSIGLVKYCEGVDYSILKEPVDIVKFDPKRREFVSDRDYVNRMRPRLENVLARYDQCLMDKYEDAIKKGDQAFNQNNMKEAIAGYQEALEIYPRETYPTKQINEINRQLGRQQKSTEEAEKKELSDKEENYNLALAKASVAYTRKDFGTAKQYYQEAMALKPGESIPGGRLQEIEVILAKKAQEAAKIKETDVAYKQNVLKADSLLKSKNYQAAREQYAKASAIKPAEGYPKAKSLEIDKIEEANVRSAETARKQAAELEYQAILTQADNQFKAKSYDEAKATYGKALAIKPSDPYASQRIKVVENSMIAERQLAQEEQANKQYREIIGSADQLLQAREWDKAREVYEKALAIKPEDQYAQSKISAIENTIAAERAAKIKSAEEGYKSAIGAANTAITQKSYVQARELLQKALTVKPGDAYATGRMGELDKIMEEQRIMLEQEASKKKRYDESLAAADKLLLSGNLQGARNAFTTLLQIKPGDAYASQKISAIDNLMAAKIAGKQRETDSSFRVTMAIGVELMVRREFEKARESFQQALVIKPGDVSATGKLREAEMILSQEQERQAMELAKKKNYDEILARADRQMNEKQYAASRRSYEEAMAVLPAEVYPRQRIDEIISILNDEEKTLASKIATDNAYTVAMASADKYSKLKEYSKAKEEYYRAISLKPGEQLPKTRLAGVEELITLQLQEQVQAKEKADAYAEAINTGNIQYAGKNYAAAKSSYTEALKLMPDDKLAREQIARIDKILLSASRFTKPAVTSGPAPDKVKTTEPVISELKFKTESERQKYQDELKKKYPEGITLEKYREQFRETYRYIIIRDNQAMDYRQIRYLTYNGIQYSMNGTSITQLYFLSQVKTRQGESFQEIDIQ